MGRARAPRKERALPPPRVAKRDESRSLSRLLQTKEAITAIAAIVGAVASLAAWGGDVIGWITGEEKSQLARRVVQPLSVGKAHIVLDRKTSSAVFTVNGEVVGVDGNSCVVRWRTYDATNDQRLRGSGLSGQKRLRLRDSVCFATTEFSMPAPAAVERLYVEVALVDDAGERLAPHARSETLALAQP
jgi:hypothetical protein